MAVVVMAYPALVPILIAAWATVAFLLIHGRLRSSPGELGAGLLLSGILAYLTLTLYVLERLPGAADVYWATTIDLLAVGAFGFLGGILAFMGASLLRGKH